MYTLYIVCPTVVGLATTAADSVNLLRTNLYSLLWSELPVCLSVIRLRIYVGLARNIVSSDRN